MNGNFNLPLEPYVAVGLTDKQELNDENINYTAYDVYRLNSAQSTFAFIFPEKREFDGAYINASATNSTCYQTGLTSGDSTNGYDGTWADQSLTAHTRGSLPADEWRTDIDSKAVSNVKAIRIVQYGTYLSWQHIYIGVIHLYGTISPGETPDRILFLDTANSDAEFSKVLDYAEVPRGQTQTRTIKLKNNSSTKTINTVQLIADDLYLNAGDWYTFSLDDVSYQATLNTIGNLGPGATKLVYVKQSVPDAETLGLQTARLKASHASLT